LSKLEALRDRSLAILKRSNRPCEPIAPFARATAGVALKYLGGAVA